MKDNYHNDIVEDISMQIDDCSSLSDLFDAEEAINAALDDEDIFEEDADELYSELESKKDEIHDKYCETLAREIIEHNLEEGFSFKEINKMVEERDEFIWNKLVQHGHSELFDDEDEMNSFCREFSTQIFENIDEILPDYDDDDEENTSVEDSKKVKDEDKTSTVKEKKYVYQFPASSTEEDIREAKKYGLEYLGKVGQDGSQPGDVLIKGTMKQLKNYCNKYLGYVMHRDYLTAEEDFSDDFLVKDSNKDVFESLDDAFVAIKKMYEVLLREKDEAVENIVKVKLHKLPHNTISVDLYDEDDEYCGTNYYVWNEETGKLIDDTSADELNEKDLCIHDAEMSFGAKVAKIVAEEFKGQCGPVGGTNPILNGNRLGLHSQFPCEWYVFNDDGSVDFENIEEIVENCVEDGSIDEEDAKEFVKHNSHFASIEDLLNSDCDWFAYPDKDKILSNVADLKKNYVKDAGEQHFLSELKEGQSARLVEDLEYDEFESIVDVYGEDWIKKVGLKEVEGMGVFPAGTKLTLYKEHGEGGEWPTFKIANEEVDFAGNLDEIEIKDIN